jgi:hypothetical protein
VALFSRRSLLIETSPGRTLKGTTMNAVTEKALALLFAIALSSAGFNTLIV